MQNMNMLAVSATLHCLTGCAIGEIMGLVLGTVLNLSNFITIIISIALAFIIGYSFSLTPLVKSGMPLKKAMALVLAADTLSIATMEIVDNATVVFIPGAMDSTLVSPLFWSVLTLSLFLAFWAAFPVNRYLLMRGKGHALMHGQH
jgi:hypothetical protein